MFLPDERRHARRRLDAVIRYGARLPDAARSAYWRIFLAIRARSTILSVGSAPARRLPMDSRQMALACARLAALEPDWRASPEDWTAPAASPLVQFRSLASHLLARYPVPRFMALVWLSAYDKPWERELYLHLAQGRSIRAFEWPVPVRLTKAAAALFLQAPDDLVPIQAVQWARFRSLGADGALARLLVSEGFLSVPTCNDDFWDTVIRFLVRHSPVAADDVLAIVRFIQAQRFRPAAEVWDATAGESPLQPEFSLRGRTLLSLRRHMANWQSERRTQLGIGPPVRSPDRWQPTAIGPFRFDEGQRVWTIEELLTPRELRVEGGLMNHCVARYIPACARRRTSIWSMKRAQDGVLRRVLTIEVQPETMTIQQARGKNDRAPTGPAQIMLGRWAQQEGLRFARKV